VPKGNDSTVGYYPDDLQTALGYGKIPASYTKYLDRNGLKGARIGVLRESIGRDAEPGSADFEKVEADKSKSHETPGHSRLGARSGGREHSLNASRNDFSPTRTSIRSELGWSA
jgi:hypothetical protein